MIEDNKQSNGKIFAITVNNDNNDEPADFEKAVLSTGFGKFNLLLLLASLPIAWAGIIDITATPFLLASAECDLELTFFRKGVLVSFPFVGMLVTSFVWDHVAERISKRILFGISLLVDSFLNILSSAIDSYYVLLLVKFISGVIAGGPLAMVPAYLAEFHATKYKPRFNTWSGLLIAVANILPAALGFMILPFHWNVDVFGRNYNTWRIYQLICMIPAILGLLIACVLPESPKQLIAEGKTEAAMTLFRRMYTMNTGNPVNTYPIKALLVRQKMGSSVGYFEKTRNAWCNTKLLLSMPYLPAFLLLSFLQFGSMLGFNTLRFWVPHLFIILNNFDAENWAPKERAPTMCEMLNRRTAEPARLYFNLTNFDDTCIEWVVRSSIYQNSTMIATSAVIFGFLFGFIHTTRHRKLLILVAAFLISVLSSFGANWAQAPPYMLTLASAIIVTTRIAGNIVTAANTDVIPIPLRPTSISIFTTMGNLGTIVGNFIFSALLGTECIAAFFGLGCFFSVCTCLALLLPKPVRTTPKTLP